MLCASVSIAHADDLLQLYGIVDGGVAYVTNEGGAHAWSQTSGVAQSDRWGLRGMEELGDGMRAIFRLENGFTLYDGRFSQGGLEFGRQAFVGIASDRLGTLTFGRQYDFMTTNLTGFSSGTLTPSVFAFHLGDLDRLGAERINNAVRYVTPQLAGLQLGALYAFGGKPGSFSSNSAAGFGASYAIGAFKAGAAYVQIHNYTAAFGIGTAVLGTPLVGTTSQGLLTPFRTFDKLTGSGVGASYQLGPALLHALLTTVDLSQGGTNASLRTAEGGLKYSISFAFSLAASYARSTLANNGWNQFVAGADYLLSKSTDIYLNAVYLHASAGVRAQIFALPASSSNSQTVVAFGMRHAF
ncbi:MAG: outer membrane protein OmpU [Paraburkholderia sp.]|nr:outer membrane protein OmpU [Paraburkholderia sp.]